MIAGSVDRYPAFHSAPSMADPCAWHPDHSCDGRRERPDLPYPTAIVCCSAKDNSHLLAFDQLQDTYSASRSALIAIAPREGSVFTRETLAALEELTEAAWQTPHSIRVNSLTNYFHSEAERDDLSIAPLVDRAVSFDDAELNRVQTIALNEPELVGQLLSDDGRVAGLIISFARVRTGRASMGRDFRPSQGHAR